MPAFLIIATVRGVLLNFGVYYAARAALGLTEFQWSPAIGCAHHAEACLVCRGKEALISPTCVVEKNCCPDQSLACCTSPLGIGLAPTFTCPFALAFQ